MNKSRKNQIKVTATAFIALMGGLTIWSCSQDELDDLQPDFYRYTPEEIATLRSLAEDYGVPDIKFATESPYPLPSIQEMEKTFAEFSTIQQIINQPFETIDSTANFKKLRTKPILYPRLTRSRGESSSKDLGQFVTAFGTNIWLDLKLTITESQHSDVEPSISLTANLQLPQKLDDTHILKKGFEQGTAIWKTKGLVGISYKCTIEKYELVWNQEKETYIEYKIAEQEVSVNTSVPV